METIPGSQVLKDLQASKQKWARLPVRDKTGYLPEPADSPLRVLEEWLQGPMNLASYWTDLITSLTALDRGDDLLYGIRLRTHPVGSP